MSYENPLAVLIVVSTMVVGVAVELVTTPLSPGNPVFPGFMWMVGAFLGAAWHLLTKRTRTGLQDRVFDFSLAGVAIGMTTYLTLLAIHLF